MTVSSVYAAPQFTGNGTTTAFAFTYPFFAPADLVVLLFNTSTNTAVSPAPVLNGGGTYDYTVTGTQDAATGEYLGGGTITFNTAPPGNYQVTVQRSVSPLQNTSLPNLAPFPAKTVEASLDRLTMLAQQLLVAAGRALQLNPNDGSGLVVALPPAASRAGQSLMFDDSGNPIAGALPAGSAPISSVMQPIVAAASLLAGANALLASGFSAGADVGFPSVALGAATMLRNRIINGDCRVDQRNAGAAQTALASGAYTIDRWLYLASQSGKFNAQQNAGAVTPPAGFASYQGMTVNAAVTVGSGDHFAIGQWIEGYNVEDLAFGTGAAKGVTLLAWVYSSIAGTHSGGLVNSAGNRCYPFTFTIPAANTWTRIAVVIPGDTAGTWVGGNGKGLGVFFNLGAGTGQSGTAGAWAAAGYTAATGAVSIVGTAGATFYFTGVELRDGTWTSAAVPERRPYAVEKFLCQRYYWQMDYSILVIGYGATAPSLCGSATVPFPAPMRAAPTSTGVWGSGYNNNSQYLTASGTGGAYGDVYSANAGYVANVTLLAGTSFNSEL